MKSYTDLEQSRKLAEILPIESADMVYLYWINSRTKKEGIDDIPIIRGELPIQNCDIPCWSLDALLEAMPQSITKYIESERCQRTFHLNLFRSYYHCCGYCFEPSVSDNDGNNTLYCIGKDSWVEACYEMIMKLHEQNLL